MSQTITGRVASDKPDKTIVVEIDIKKTHPIYRKKYSRRQKFAAHDEKNEARIGDLVIIRESRPISSRKRFTLDRIVEHAHAGFVETDTTADVPLEEIEDKNRPEANKAKAKGFKSIKGDSATDQAEKKGKA